MEETQEIKTDLQTAETRVIEQTLPAKTWTKECQNTRCKKIFQAPHQATRFCSPACQTVYKKRRKSKSRTDKAYKKEHNVTRALEAASRRIARRIMMMVYEPRCYITNVVFDNWDFLQAHHIDGNPFNNTPTNVVPLSSEGHNKLEAELKKLFGQDKGYSFGFTYENLLDKTPLEFFDSNLAKEQVIYQLAKFQYRSGIPLPKFNLAS